MHSLREIQTRIAEFIRSGEGVLDPGILFDDHLRGDARVEVYRNNYRIGMSQALGAVYPVVRRLVGEDFFRYLAQHYIRCFPSCSGNINDYGESLAEFLAGFRPAAALPYLPDVARLEWRYHVAFHAHPGMPLTSDQFTAAASAGMVDLVLRFQPAVGWLLSDFPVLRIWELNRDESAAVPELDLNAGGDAVIIYRRGLEIELVRLPPADYAFLKVLAEGGSLGMAMAAAAPGFEPARVLGWALRTGIITGLMVMEE